MCKALFGDLLHGYYIPEELGAAVNADGDVEVVDVESVGERIVDAEIVFDVAAAKQSLVAAYKGVYAASEGCERDPLADAADHWAEHADEHGPPTCDQDMPPLIAEALTRARANTLDAEPEAPADGDGDTDPQTKS